MEIKKNGFPGSRVRYRIRATISGKNAPSIVAIKPMGYLGVDANQWKFNASQPIRNTPVENAIPGMTTKSAGWVCWKSPIPGTSRDSRKVTTCVGITICITCVWAGVDNTWVLRILEARKLPENGAESPASGARFLNPH